MGFKKLLNEGEIIRYMPFINTGLMENYRVDYNGQFMGSFPWRPDQTSKEKK
jgi:hypothetical protein